MRSLNGHTGILLKEFFVVRHLPVLFFLFIGGLGSLVIPVQIAFAAQEPIMRVLLDQAKNLRFRADRDIPLLIEGISSGERQAVSLTLRRRSGRLEAIFPGSSRKSLRFGDQSVISIRTTDPRGVWFGNRRYKGALRIILKNGLLTVVNHVGIESYLASVIGSEMPKAWPMNALQAQAIAARTYALKRFSNKNFFDVQATMSDQVYLGVEAETKSTREAAKTTRTLVLAHKGKLINAVFHSSSGGVTEPSGDVWREQLPYLISVKDFDDQSPSRKWSMAFTPRYLRRAFHEVNGLKSIRIQRQSLTGRVKKVLVIGPMGTISITGQELRRRLGLKSTLVRFEMLDSKPQKHDLLDVLSNSQVDPKRAFRTYAPQQNLEKPMYSINSQASRNNLDSFRFDGQKDFDSLSQPPSLPPLGAPPLSPPSLFTSPPSLLPKIEVSTNRPFLYVRGLGAGHGVGMSQWGAYGLAKRGLTFRQILKHYYTGVQVVPYRRIR